MKLTKRTRVACWPTKEKPLVGAIVVPAVYVAVATAYIFLSGYLAALLTANADQLAAVESIKGFLFVLITGGLLYILCYVWLRRLRDQTTLLIQSERRAVAGMASASVAHDINNLLMVLSGLLHGLKEQEDGNTFLRSMREDLEVSIEDLSALSQSLVRAARDLEPDDEEEVDIATRLELITKIIKKHPDVRTCKLDVHTRSPVKLVLNAALFEQAALNLMINAAQAAGPQGEVKVSLVPGDETVVLRVEDSGPGVDTKQVERIFSPGYTTKENGSGLGLLCVRAFADACHAKVSVHTSALGGAAFQLEIPV